MSGLSRVAEKPLRTVCAWCQRVKNAAGEYEAGQPEAGAKITHGICPPCSARERAILERAKEGRK